MKIVAVVFLTLAFCFSGLAQKRNKIPRVLVDKAKPSVYITFLKKLQSKSVQSQGVENYLLFKLTNNTLWPIVLEMSGPDIDDVAVSLYYLVENRKTGERRAGNLYCHVCSFNSLGPSKSLSFAVPLENACNDAKMTVRFRYDWEDEFAAAEGSETLHTTVFYFDSIPESVLPLMREADRKFMYQQDTCYAQ